MLSSFFSNPIELITRLIAVLLALSFHEWGHAYAAYKLGDPTAKNLGRMTIDPTKHIDLIGLIAMILFRFGWAKPVPINPNNFKNIRRDEIIVSLAGITINFLFAFFTIFIYLLINLFYPITNNIVISFVNNLYFINIALMVFNILPIPPLDGYHVFKNLTIRKISPKFFWAYERYGIFILLALILFGFTSSILTFLVNLINNGIFSFLDLIF